jgi:hypothetical protein
MGPVGEAVEGTVCQDRIIKQGDPFIHGAVGRDYVES